MLLAFVFKIYGGYSVVVTLEVVVLSSRVRIPVATPRQITELPPSLVSHPCSASICSKRPETDFVHLRALCPLPINALEVAAPLETADGMCFPPVRIRI